VDHDHRLSGSDRGVVPGHVGKLVHHGERHDPSQAGEEAVDGARRVEARRAFVAAEDGDVAIRDTRGLDGAGRGGCPLAIRQHREERIDRVADEPRLAPAA
jgi:hypothetical protein